MRGSKSQAVVVLLILALLSVGCESATTRYEKHLAAGRESLGNGRLQEAILSFKSALAARPEDFDARRLLLECYLERGAEEPAKAILETLAKESPDDLSLPLLGVRLALLEGDADRALEVLQGYMEVHGEVPAALVLVGDAHAAKEMWSEALKAYDLALNKDGTNAQAWLGKSSLLQKLKRNKEAMAAAQHATEADPHLGRAHLIVAEIATADGDLDAARAAYNRALEKDQRVTLTARYGLGQVLFAQKDAKGGLEQGEALVRDFPSRPEGYALRGTAHYLLTEYDDAVGDLQKCLSIAPDHPGPQFYLALAQYQRKQWQQALGAAKSLQTRFPGKKPIEILIAELLLRTGDYKEAAKQAQAVLDRSPDSALMYRVLGVARIHSGDPDGGAEALEEAQRLAPDERLEFALGDLYLSMNELDKAATNFEAIAEAKPQDRGAYVRLFYTRLRQRDVDGALGLMDSLLQEKPGDPMWLNLRAVALSESQQDAKAEEVWKEVVRTSPELGAARLNLAELYLRQARWAEARKQYEELLSLSPEQALAHKKLAELDLRDGRPKDAATHLRATLAIRKDGTVAMALAALLLRMGDAEGAYQAANTATEVMPGLAAPWLQRGIVGRVQGNLSAAEADLRKASELAPESAKVWFQLGGLEAQRGDWKAVARYLEKAAVISPDDVDVMALQVKAALATGENSEAERMAGDFLKGHRDQLTAYRVMAAVQEADNRPQRAKQTLANAREHLGETPEILLMQAEFERRQGDSAAATALYNRVLEIDPNAAPVLVRKAEAALAEGRFEEAAASYEAVIGLLPDQPLALNNLAYLYTDVLARPADALAALKRVDPKVVAGTPAIRDTLGWAQLKAGDAAAAVATLAKVVEELPEVGAVRYHYGAALLAAGRDTEGRREVEAALSMKLSSAEAAAARKLLGAEQE